MKTFTLFFSKFLTVILTFLLSFFYTANCQTGSFNRYVSQDGWGGNVEFNVPSGTGSKPLVIGLHPAQSPAWGIRDMLKSSSNDKNFILVCPDGADNSLSQSIIPLINYCKSQFNIDETKIYLTGYSAGGYTTFSFGPTNYQLFKGLIGIAAYGYGVSQSAINSLGFAMICGTSDQIISDCRSFNTQLENAGAHVKLIEVAGVAHTGAYYFSGEFTDDWNECYDFINNFIPKPGKITLTSPYNGQEDVEIPVLLEWEEDPKATSYEVEISDADGLVERKTPTTNSVSIKNLQPGTEYTWIVVGKNDGGEGTWSNEWMFTTKPVAPTAQATLMEPANGTINLSKNIDFKWEVIPGATEYQIHVLNEADSIIKEYDNIEPEDDGTVLKTVRNLPLGTSFKWQVRGKNSAGEAPWSEQWTFATAPAPPGMVTLLEPEHNVTDLTTLPILKWNLLTNADRYHLELIEILAGDYFNTVINDSNITIVGGDTGFYQIKEDLKGLTKYKWHIAGINSGGRGVWSEFRIFTTWDPLDVKENIASVYSSRINPNPINSVGYIDIYSENSEQIDIEFHNILGQTSIVLSNLNLEAGYNRIPIDLSYLNSGLHFYTILGKSNSEVKSFIIQR